MKRVMVTLATVIAIGTKRAMVGAAKGKGTAAKVAGDKEGDGESNM
jgi:hypothetical protein